MNVREIVCEGVNWNYLALHRDQWRALVEAVIKLPVPKNAGNFLTSRATISFSRKSLLPIVG
jgi:hypothetical protein